MLQRLIRLIFPLRDFQTKEELVDWYNKYAGLSLPQGNHCDDHALEARALAEQDGYFLSECLVAAGKVYYTQIDFDKDGQPDMSMNHLGHLARVIEGTDGSSDRYYLDLNWRVPPTKLCGTIPGGKYVGARQLGGQV
jgi:hypothetical protein